jgi:hypothetical protein
VKSYLRIFSTALFVLVKKKRNILNAHQQEIGGIRTPSTVKMSSV